jgi:CRISPR-associated endoribonuclease Cas6
VNDNGLLVLRDKIFSNACRKAKVIYKDFEEPEDNFIEGIIQLNKIPISTKYKGATLLGAKVEVTVKGDERSQLLAYTVMGAGMLEKNSIGYGFCIAK